MSKEDFENVPYCKEYVDNRIKKIVCDSLVILRSAYRHKNSSGFGYMDIITVREEEAICRYSGIDMLSIVNRKVSKNMETVCGLHVQIDWHIDFLSASGLVRIHPLVHRILCVPTLTTLMLYPIKVV